MFDDLEICFVYTFFYLLVTIYRRLFIHLYIDILSLELDCYLCY
jgi:hypothetical protein